MSKPCPTFNLPEHHALQRVNDQLRRLNEAAIFLNQDSETLNALAAQIEHLADQMAGMQGERMLPQFHHPAVATDPNAFLSYSPVSGRFNPTAPPIEFHTETVNDTAKVIGNVYFNRIYEGPPNMVHGSWVAAIYDQILAFNTVINKAGGPTAYLHVDYLKPTPIETELRFEAWVKSFEGKKMYTEGACYAGDELITKAEALFITHRPAAAK